MGFNQDVAAKTKSLWGCNAYCGENQTIKVGAHLIFAVMVK